MSTTYKKYKYYYGLHDRIMGEGEDFFESYLFAQNYAKELALNMAKQMYPEDAHMWDKIIHYGVKS